VLLEELLGEGYVVRAGMRHGEPSIDRAIGECKALGATKMVGIILSPQFSSVIMTGYTTAFAEASQKHGFADHEICIAGPWPTQEHFVELLARRVESAIKKLQELHTSIPVVFTTHSLPLSVVAKDPLYLSQLKKTIDTTLEKIDSTIEWYAGYQSAGHTPEEWLKPDLVDILGDLKNKGNKTVLIVPIQFLADHLEILYDLDIAGKAQCEEFDIEYNRIELPNTDPLFIKALHAIVKETESNL
jgi:ferrochelatase